MTALRADAYAVKSLNAFQPLGLSKDGFFMYIGRNWDLECLIHYHVTDLHTLWFWPST